MPPSLYPLKFRPRFVEKLWGGRKLEMVLGKRLAPGKQIGESWELYDFPPGVVEGSSEWISSEIANGPLAGGSLHWALGEFGPDLHGAVPLTEQGQFPVLLKFLDAREDLSVQVHPDPRYALANPGAHVKNEAWYVLQRDPGSRLLNGLVRGTTREQLEEAIRNGGVERLIQAHRVQEGDCFYLPSGTVHALGAGILVAEVQTPSDTTFRVFDFNRTDPATGKPRRLHLEEALRCIDFSGRDDEMLPDATGSGRITCPHFHLEQMQLAAGAERPARSGLSVMVLTNGSMQIADSAGTGPILANRGDVVLLPAVLRAAVLRGVTACTWLEVSFPAAPNIAP